MRGLQVQDIDTKLGTISITKTLLEHGGRILVGPTKNHHKGGKRTASLLDAIATDRPAEIILKRLAAHVKGKAPDAFVFEKPSGGAMTYGSLKQRWLVALDRAGVRYREVEQLRHSYVSAMLSRGANLLKLSTQTGHKVPTMLSHYAEFMPQDQDATIRTPGASRLRLVK